ncbi:TonB-dependent receptor domain-containing protein [Niabella insulamsoli]|uniref:TonB-dependent receptor domain-containing protein n=1 Tax=Niabella insulamsoli TaxID=3144874 RepID=UPI0031FCB3A8
MTRFFAFALALFFCETIAGQTITMKGVVVDSTTQEVLPQATIRYIAKDGATLATNKADRKGNFTFVMQHSASGRIVVSHVGYQTKTLSVNAGAESTIDLGTVSLLPNSYSLAAVVVQGKKAPVSFKIDRQVYQSSQFANAANGTAVDVIRNLPSVSVDAQGAISFRGSNSFLVLINGKPTQGDPSFVLGQLAAGAIESIEVITSPSAVYDADGKSGILNIVTKSAVEDGWMVQASVMGGAPPFNNFDNQTYAHPQRYGMDLSAGYNKNKWAVNAGVNYLRNDIAGFREGDVFTIINNIKTSFPSNGERSFRRYNYGGRLSVSFQPDQNNSFSTGFYRGKKFQSREADLLYTNSREDLATGNTTYFTYYNANTQDKEGVFTLANLDYSHQFGDASRLTVSGLFERAALSGLTQNRNLYYPNTTDTIQYTRNPNTNPLNAYRAKADYVKKWSHSEIQAGYQYRYDTQKGDFRYLTKINGTEDFETDPAFTSKVDVTNHINAGYLQYNATREKWSYAAGLRLEHTERDLAFSLDNKQTKLQFTNLFPSVQFRYAAWAKGTLKAGYSRRIKRTNNFELNPFPEREHSETLEQGDPELLPELTGTYEAGLEQGFSGGNFFVTLYHQRTLNPIQRVNKVFTDTILNRVFTNAGLATQTGVETNVNFQVSKVWQSIIGGNVYRYKIKGDLFDGTIPITNQAWVYSINSLQTFNFQRNWMLQFSLNYLSLRATAQGEDGAFLTPHLTMKKTTKDRRWYVQLQWLNMDGGLGISNRQRITTWGSDFYTTTHYIYEPDQLQLSIGFNLLRRNRKINLPQSEIGEKEF